MLITNTRIDQVFVIFPLIRGRLINKIHTVTSADYIAT